MRREFLSICNVLLFLPLATPLFADMEGVTLKSWQQEVWDKISDRNGNLNPPPSILSRFNALEDKEYRLDERTYGFDLSEDFEWRRHSDGMRYWTGSIDHFRLIELLELKKQVGLFSDWKLEFLYRKVSSLESIRNLSTFRFYHPYLHFEILIRPGYWKPAQDAEIAWGFEFGKGLFLEARVAWLDLFNNSVIILEEKFGKPVSERLYYEKIPAIFATEAHWRLTSTLRLELYGALSNLSRLSLRFLENPQKNSFREEEVRYAGGLLEWKPYRRILISGYGTYVKANTAVKGEFPASSQDQTQMEKTNSAGIYLIFRPNSDWQLLSWLSWIYRPEERIYQEDLRRSIKHRDKEQLLSLELGYDWHPKWRNHVAYLRDKRLAKGLAEARFRLPNNRLEFGVRYRFTAETEATVSVNLELDRVIRGTHEASLYDGSSIQLISIW